MDGHSPYMSAHSHATLLLLSLIFPIKRKVVEREVVNMYVTCFKTFDILHRKYFVISKMWISYRNNDNN